MNVNGGNDMNITWNADTYDQQFSYVPQYGNDVLTWILKEPPASVLDLGCGSGVLTEELKKIGYRVMGMDASKSLLSLAKSRYPETKFLLCDATNFSLDTPVDVVFSNAVFHWIEEKNQKKMLSCVYRALKPNGEFVFEFGGFGNNAQIHAALSETFSAHGYRYQMPFYFPTMGQYAALLESCGFLVTQGALFNRPTKLTGESGMLDFMTMFIKTPFLTVPDEKEREQLKKEAAERLRNSLYENGTWYADYVRLRMRAKKVGENGGRICER